MSDDATRALMVKLYELWSPVRQSRVAGERTESRGGLGAAAALRKAQEYIRSHEKWRHPYYWAAWVLWGAPD